MTAQNQTDVKRAFPRLFFGLAFSLSWLIWIVVIATGVTATPLHIFAGAVVPSVVGIALTQRSPSKEQHQDFWKRVTDFKRIGIRRYGVIVFLFPAILVATFVLNHLLGGPPLALAALQQVLNNPLQLVLMAIMMFLGGPLAEELGWRGYALDRLQARWSVRTSSLILGVIWAFWHLPLFFMPGTHQATIGMSWGFWLFILDVVLFSMVISWVYNHTQRSTLSAILLHWIYNFSMAFAMFESGTIPLQTAFIKTGLTLIVCIPIFVSGLHKPPDQVENTLVPSDPNPTASRTGDIHA